MAKKKKNLNSYSLALKDAFMPPRVTNEPFNPNAVDYRAELEWRDGVPYLINAPVRISEQPEATLRTLLRKCLDLPYDGRDPTLKGLSQGEAMIINMTRDAASGDSDARTQVIDRFLGRPTQKSEAVNLTGDLNEFLDKVAEATKIETVEVESTEVVPNDSAEDL